jgi:hypothetical protein
MTDKESRLIFLTTATALAVGKQIGPHSEVRADEVR